MAPTTRPNSQIQGPFLTSCAVQYLASVLPHTTITQAKFWWNEKGYTFLPQHICPQHRIFALVLCSTEMFLCSWLNTIATSQALSHGTSSQDKVSSSNFIGHNSLQVLSLCTLCLKFSCKWFSSPHQENKEWALTAVIGLPCLLHIRHAGSSHVYFFSMTLLGIILYWSIRIPRANNENIISKRTNRCFVIPRALCVIITNHIKTENVLWCTWYQWESWN